MIRCCACRQCFPTLNALELEHELTSGSVPLALKHFDSCACFNDFSCIVWLIHVSIHNFDDQCTFKLFD